MHLKRRVLIIYIIMCETFLILNGKERDMITQVNLYSFKLPVILLSFMQFGLSTHIFEKH